MATSDSVKLWTRFTKNRNGQELKLRIQELPKDKFEDHMFDFLFKYFVPDEPLHKASKVSLREEALEEYRQGFIMMSKEINYQVDACFVDDDAEDMIVGLSIMVLEKKNEPCDDLEAVKSMVKAEEIKTLLSLSTCLDGKCKIFEKFDVDACYKGRGVVVHKDYRGLGIAGELLKVRSLVCKDRGVPITSAWMTSIGTQKAAAKLGWDTISEQKYTDLEKEVGGEFEEEPSSCKLMIIKV